MAGARTRKKAQTSSLPKPGVSKEKQIKNHSKKKTPESSSEEETLLKSKQRSKSGKTKAEIVLTSRRQRQVRRISRSYIDEEAEENNETEDSDKVDEEEDGFIDDRDEGDLTNEDSTDEEKKNEEDIEEEEEEKGKKENEEEEAEDEEEKIATPPTVKRKHRFVDSPIQPVTPRATRRNTTIPSTPKTPTSSSKTSRTKKKSARQDDGNDSDVIEIPKPSAQGSPKSKSRVDVTLLDGPIKMSATHPKKKGNSSQAVETPILDAEQNPFVTTSADEMEIDKSAHDTPVPSPRKKVKTESGDAKPAKIKKEHNAVNDTPVTGMARIMENSVLASDSDSDADAMEIPGVEQVSDPDNPVHAKLMCKYMKPSYRGRHAPPPITDPRGVKLCPDPRNGGKVPNSFITFGTAMANVGVKKNTPLWNNMWNATIQSVFGPFVYNLARIDPRVVRLHEEMVNGYRQVTFRITENISGSPGWSPNAGVAFAMFGSVSGGSLQNSTQRTINGTLKWVRLLTLHLLAMEFYRDMNILAGKFDVPMLGAHRWDGFSFSTVPTRREYGDAGGSQSPRKRRPAARESSEEPEIDVPAESIAGKAVQATSVLPQRAEIQRLAAAVPIYDYTHTLKNDDLPLFNQETLHVARPWTQGEIPVGSWVCVHYVPSSYIHETHRDVQWNLLRVVVLAVPQDD